MSRNDLSVLYYTSCTENPEFEEKIRQELLKVIGDLPLISISQKPIDFGKNICVGNIGQSYRNEFKQVLIGCKEAKTDYVIMAESDCLYPPEYFTFIPQTEHCYRYANVWIMQEWIGVNTGNSFRRKMYSDCAQIVGREYMIKKIEEYLENKDAIRVIDSHLKYSWKGINPVINIKTISGGMNRYTAVIPDEEPKQELPYWGEISKLRERLFK
jgi:hypothetical protein